LDTGNGFHPLHQLRKEHPSRHIVSVRRRSHVDVSNQEIHSLESSESVSGLAMHHSHGFEANIKDRLKFGLGCLLEAGEQ
jgi:hypothetical protein